MDVRRQNKNQNLIVCSEIKTSVSSSRTISLHCPASLPESKPASATRSVFSSYKNRFCSQMWFVVGETLAMQPTTFPILFSVHNWELSLSAPRCSLLSQARVRQPGWFHWHRRLRVTLALQLCSSTRGSCPQVTAHLFQELGPSGLRTLVPLILWPLLFSISLPCAADTCCLFLLHSSCWPSPNPIYVCSVDFHTLCSPGLLPVRSLQLCQPMLSSHRIVSRIGLLLLHFPHDLPC